ncbi:hypothetical protein [Marinagarivorans algicola]|uniref:hypothetical protein n=1 Tax=Marinagarivorans algicola TaxID=1513270 RepID=UPI0006B98F66|nr:hypothetical protein [Marinagarivorans algicola]
MATSDLKSYKLYFGSLWKPFIILFTPLFLLYIYAVKDSLELNILALGVISSVLAAFPFASLISGLIIRKIPLDGGTLYSWGEDRLTYIFAVVTHMIMVPASFFLYMVFLGVALRNT